MSINYKKIFLYAFVFIYIFNPTNFSSFNLLFVLTLISAAFISLNFKVYSPLLLDRRIVVYIAFFLYLLCYLVFFYASGKDGVILRIYTIILVIFSLICSLFIVITYRKLYALQFHGFLGFVINVGVIQLFFVMLSLLIPEFRDWILATSRFENLISISNDYGGLRSYGLALGYTSTFPMFMGVCSLIVISFFAGSSIKLSSFRYILLFSLFTFSVILNARIGLVPIAIFFIAYSVLFFLELKKLPAFFVFFVLLLLGSIPLMVFFDLEKYFTRFVWAYDEISKLLAGEVTGTFAVLQTMIFFPSDSFGFLFGSGLDVFGVQTNTPNSSDIGLVKDIYLYGAVNVFIFLGIIIYFTGPLTRVFRESFGLTFLVAFWGSLLAFYLKGAVWASSEIYNFVVLAAVFSIVLKPKPCLTYRKVDDRD